MIIVTSNAMMPLAALIAVAAAEPQYGCKPQTICVDAVNKCGVKYGGCYNVCDEAAKPKPPPCSSDDCQSRTVCADMANSCGQLWGTCFADCKPWPSMTAPPCEPSVTDRPPITTVSTVTFSTISSSTASGDDCSTRTVCADYINECGQMCFPDCKPWPTFTPPPCTSTSTMTPSTPTPVTDDCSTRTVCADYVNECGQMYGGCFPDCKPWPTFTPPPCTKTTKTTKTKKTRTRKTKTTPSPTTDDCSTRTVCADYVNECGQWYGGCFPDCKPWPTFTPPPCTLTTTTTPPVVTPPPETTSCTATDTVCVDSINACGQTYGGCFPNCKPWPTFTPPPCPKETYA